MRKSWIPHFIAITGLLVFSVLGLGSAATTPAARRGVPAPAAAPAPAPAPEAPVAAAPAAPAPAAPTPALPAPPAAAPPAPAAPAQVLPRVVAIENIGDARISRAPWAAHTIIPSKNYTVVGAVVVRTTNEATVLADLMERAIAMGGHDIKNVIITRTMTDDGPRITSAIAVAIRYTNETLVVRDERFPGRRPDHSIVEEQYILSPQGVRAPW